MLSILNDSFVYNNTKREFINEIIALRYSNSDDLYSIIASWNINGTMEQLHKNAKTNCDICSNRIYYSFILKDGMRIHYSCVPIADNMINNSPIAYLTTIQNN